MKIRKPLWKIIKRGESEYAEILLRCDPSEFGDAKAWIEKHGSIQKATDAILGLIEQQHTTDKKYIALLNEIQKQHVEQLEAIKQQLTKVLGQRMTEFAPPEKTESIMAEVWETIDK